MNAQDIDSNRGVFWGNMLQCTDSGIECDVHAVTMEEHWINNQFTQIFGVTVSHASKLGCAADPFGSSGRQVSQLTQAKGNKQLCSPAIAQDEAQQKNKK